MEGFFIIGHRGAAGEQFENSISGFKRALTLDIDAIELDIQEHSGELWVMHDYELQRLTGHSGIFSQIDHPNNIRLLNGEPIPTLRAVLDLCWGKVPLNIEIKSTRTLPLLLDLLSCYPALPPKPDFPWILISSFDHRQILELRELNCPWPLSPIFYGVPILLPSIIETLQPFSLHMDDQHMDIDHLQQMKDLGTPIIVFTVNDKQRARTLKKAGAAGIFTDFPSEMLNLD